MVVAALRQRTHTVQADTEVGRIPPGQDPDVRRVCQRRVRRRVRETDAFRGEAVEDRRSCQLVAVRAETIGSERVDCDEQHVGRDELLAFSCEP